ncbi:MAG: tyrosine--tRNA ligase [Alphaproteobacteria bacterium]|nr:tyrosine--tRNA ligase [Alphaproteobacteria bacterium]
MPKSELLHILTERGFIHQLTHADEMDNLFAKQQNIAGYIGFDATADSLHIGSLLQIMLLRWLQKTGHQPIVLMGGGTSMIGDPSGKDTQRKMLTMQDIDSNIIGIKKIFSNYIDFDNDKALMLNNADWLMGLGYIPLLRDIGAHFSINRMMNFDSVKLRLEREQPLSFLEFNYMILQAYDFMVLARDYDCRLQMGGSDQWGNIVNGIELARRLLNKDVFGVTSPLLTTASGAKMGKSAGGAIWLNEDKLPCYDFWQYWRNVEDADVGKFLRLFTELPLDEIARLESLRDKEINEAKIILATEVTTLCHGKAKADKAAKTAQTLFASNSQTAENMPEFSLNKSDLGDVMLLAQLLVVTGLCDSNSDARRQIKGGAVRINDAKIDDDKMSINSKFFIENSASGQDNAIKLSCGKKKHLLVKLL